MQVATRRVRIVRRTDAGVLLLLRDVYVCASCYQKIWRAWKPTSLRAVSFTLSTFKYALRMELAKRGFTG